MYLYVSHTLQVRRCNARLEEARGAHNNMNLNDKPLRRHYYPLWSPTLFPIGWGTDVK